MFFTVADLAARWQLSGQAVRALIRGGRLPAIDVGRGGRPNWRVSPEAVEAFEANHGTRPNVRRKRERAGTFCGPGGLRPEWKTWRGA